MSDEPTPLRLKPRLKLDTPAGASAAVTPPPAPAAPVGGEEAPKIRLRPKLSMPVEPAPEPVAPPAEELPAEEQPVDEQPALEASLEEAPPPPPPPDPTAGGEFPKF